MAKKSGPPPTAGPLGDFVPGDYIEVYLSQRWVKARLMFFLSDGPFVRFLQEDEEQGPEVELDRLLPTRLLRPRREE